MFLGEGLTGVQIVGLVRQYADQGRPPGHYNVGRVRQLGH
jgi:hypothetical protein